MMNAEFLLQESGKKQILQNPDGSDYRSMIHGFMNSVEYRGRFGP